MALARTYAMALAGVQGHVVEIEADIENGLGAVPTESPQITTSAIASKAPDRLRGVATGL